MVSTSYRPESMEYRTNIGKLDAQYNVFTRLVGY